MITSPQSYNEILDSIKNNPDMGLGSVVKMVNPDTEPIFVIDSNKRTITVPKELQTIGVAGDHNAETVYFEIDRYFDSYDLKQLACLVQYRNAIEDEYIFMCDPNEYVVVDEDGASKIRFGWTVGQTVTAAEGMVEFAVRFFTLEDSELVYSFNTKPAIVQVARGLNVTANPAYNPVPEPIVQKLDALKEIVDNISEVQGSIQYSKLNDLPKINNVTLLGVDQKAGGYTSAELKLVGDDNFVESFKAHSSIASNTQTFTTIDEVLKATTIFNPYLTANDIDATLSSTSTKAIQNKAVYKKFEEMKQELGDSVYIPIEVLSFYNDVLIAEKGSKVTSVTFNYTFNQVPNALTLQLNDGDAEQLAVEGNSYTKTDLSLTSDAMFTLTASDKKEHSDSLVSEIRFLNGVYFGAAAETDTYSNSFILGLEKVLSSDHDVTFTVNAGEGQYIYYCAPSAYGNPFISVNGLVGGFEKVQTVNFINSYNHVESYDIYRTHYDNLGSTFVVVE